MITICLSCGTPLDDPNRLVCGHCPDIKLDNEDRDHMDDMDAMYDEAESFYPEPPEYDEHGVRIDSE